MPEIAPAQLEAQFNALPPDQKRAAIAFRKQGKDASRAIFMARNEADSADAYDREQPSKGESIAAGGLGAAEAVHSPTTFGKVVSDLALNPVAYPIDSTEYLARKLTGTDEKAKEAQDAAPGAYGAGNIVGNGLNALMAAASLGGGLKDAAPFERSPTEHAIEGIPKSGSSLGQSLQRLVGGGAQKLVDLADKHPLLRAGAGLKSAGASEALIAGARGVAKATEKARAPATSLAESLRGIANPKTTIAPEAVAGYGAKAEAAPPSSAPAMATEDAGSLNDYIEAAKSLVPNNPDVPPSMVDSTPASPSGGDWHLTPDQLAGDTPVPPNVAAELEQIAARATGKATTPLASTRVSRKAPAIPVDMEQPKSGAEPDLHAAAVDMLTNDSPAADIAGAQAKLDPSLANDVADGDLSLRAAAARSRGAARAANAPTGQPAIKESILQLVKSDPKLAQNMSAKAGEIAKRLGIKTSDAKMAINAIAWGR